MKERVFTVRNSAGIHCRPSSVILSAIKNEFPDHHFEIETGNGIYELNSILILISMALSQGSQGVLRVEGVDEVKAIERIGDLLEYEFDFPPR